MSESTPHFPDTLWDGYSPQRPDRQEDRSPSGEDWNQIVSEVIALQAAILDGVFGDTERGEAAGTGVSDSPLIGKVIKTVLTLTAVNVDITSDADGYGSLKVFDPPAGNIYVLGATADLTITVVGASISATGAVVGSIGTTAAADDNATLTTTEANIVPSTTFTLTGGTKNSKMNSTTPAVFVDPDVYLNFAVPDVDIGADADALTVEGTITLHWVNLGDV